MPQGDQVIISSTKGSSQWAGSARHDNLQLSLFFMTICRQQQNKKARKEARKEEKQRALEQKREAIEQLLAGMTEQERKDWHQKNKVREGFFVLPAASVPQTSAGARKETLYTRQDPHSTYCSSYDRQTVISTFSEQRATCKVVACHKPCFVPACFVSLGSSGCW